MNLRRVVFFFCSSIIIGLLIAWGFDGFKLFTETKESVQIVDDVTGNFYNEVRDRFTLGLDLVVMISIGVVGLGFILVNVTKMVSFPRGMRSQRKTKENRD